MPRQDRTPKELDQLYRQAKAAKGRLEPVWFMNMAYFNNEHWLAWDNRQLYRPVMPKGRITITDNRITPAVRTEIAKITKQQPIFTVVPQSSDEEDANAAELGEQLMRYLWKHLNMHELATKCLEWSRVCCAGFFKTFWDPSL